MSEVVRIPRPFQGCDVRANRTSRIMVDTDQLMAELEREKENIKALILRAKKQKEDIEELDAELEKLKEEVAGEKDTPSPDNAVPSDDESTA